MEIDQEKFDKVKSEAEELYEKTDKVFCPYLKADVMFNAKGLDHIKFKGWNRTRSMLEQYMRFKLFPLAPDIIKDSHTLQEFYETNRLERQKVNSRWEQRMIKVRYYGFVAVIKNTRVKVIVKEVDGGSNFFWSIIPFWKSRKDEFSNKIKKILHEGDLETQ